MNAPVQPDLTGHVELPWHRGPLASFDTETTGTQIDIARIVSAALIRPNGETLRWLSDVNGLEIPAAATAVHGITTEHARAHGRPAKQVVEEIADALAGELAGGHTALVVMNAPFDLSLLDAECARHGVRTLADRIGDVRPMVDPLVLDRAVDKYRKGRRNLESLAAHYGVPLDDAHNADVDALAALQVARAIGERYEDLQVPARVLHGWQVAWHEKWAANYQQFLRKSRPDAVVEQGWPVRPMGGAA
ncbi:exonuclease domain-containing protein [Streptomyces scabiei]|uniref:exonuclease domain-containing protein n=1 Tax=Streptomyces scabiei TaxID=1930 RepID=UPI00062936E7|nr:exonuclease domain-containing protein [Streptomyces scabiei]MDX3681403.1 exonuclease domain-containing protein [Streptomyces scabiei]